MLPAAIPSTAALPAERFPPAVPLRDNRNFDGLARKTTVDLKPKSNYLIRRHELDDHGKIF
jgi:hypothetical protein